MLWWLRLNTSAVNSRLYYMFGFKINCKQILFHTALWAAQHHIATWGHLCLRHLLLGNKKTSVLIGWANMKFWKKKKKTWILNLSTQNFELWMTFFHSGGNVLMLWVTLLRHAGLESNLLLTFLYFKDHRTQTTKYPFNQWNRFDFDLCEEKSKQFPHPI